MRHTKKHLKKDNSSKVKSVCKNNFDNIEFEFTGFPHYLFYLQRDSNSRLANTKFVYKKKTIILRSVPTNRYIFDRKYGKSFDKKTHITRDDCIEHSRIQKCRFSYAFPYRRYLS